MKPSNTAHSQGHAEPQHHGSACGHYHPPHPPHPSYMYYPYGGYAYGPHPYPHPGAGYDSRGRCGGHGYPRRKKRRFFKFLLLLLLLWGTASLSFHYGGAIVRIAQLNSVVQEMQLSPVQEQRLKGVMWKAWEKNQTFRGSFQKMHTELFELMDKKKLTQQELDDFIKRSVGTFQSVLLSNSKYLLQARSVLTPQQRKILLVRLHQLKQKRRCRKALHRHPAAVH